MHHLSISCIHVYTYSNLATHNLIYIYMYIYIYGEIDTVSFHNFKSRNFKSRVSNPKSKYVAYLSVLSQISNCQGLGRNKKI